MTYAVDKTDEQWRAELTPEQYAVLRQAGTERAWTGELLDEAGWGVIWRTGHYTRSKAVAKAHRLEKNEELLGWLYVGGKPARDRPGHRKPLDARKVIARMPQAKKPGTS